MGNKKPIQAYKAFNKDLMCQGYQFEIGKTYENEQGASICKYGFHACTNPLDTLNYYDLTTSRFCKIELSGEIDKKKDGDAKLCGSVIKIGVELSLGDFIVESVNSIIDLCKKAKKNYASGDSSRAASSGDSSRAASSGDYSSAASSGYSNRFTH